MRRSLQLRGLKKCSGRARLCRAENVARRRLRRASPYRSLVLQERNDRRRLQLLAPVQKLQFDQELCFHQDATHFANQRGGGSRRPTGGEQIIDQNNSLSPLDGIDMEFHFGLAVLKSVFRALGFIRQPPFFAKRHKTNSELVRDRGAEKKSARVDSDDLVGLFAPALLEKHVDRGAKKRAVAEDRRDVLKDDPRLRKIRDITHRVSQLS